MPVLLIVLAGVLVAFAPPRPVNLKFHLHGSGASPADLEQINTAFRRGFYSNSSVTPPAETLSARPAASLPIDSARRARIGMIVVLDGFVRVTDTRVEVCTQLLNVLAQPITEPDTLHVDRSALNSALAVAGHKHADAFARRSGRRGPSNMRCS